MNVKVLKQLNNKVKPEQGKNWWFKGNTDGLRAEFKVPTFNKKNDKNCTINSLECIRFTKDKVKLDSKGYKLQFKFDGVP